MARETNPLLATCISCTADAASDADDPEVQEAKEREQMRCHRAEKEAFYRHAQGGSKSINVELLPLAMVELHLGGLYDPSLGRDADQDGDGVLLWKEFKTLVNHLLIEEAKLFASKAAPRIKALRQAIRKAPRDDTERIMRAADELRAVWKKHAPVKTVLRWFHAMKRDPEAQLDRIRMLDCLVFTVPLYDDDGQWNPGVGDKSVTSFGKFHGERFSNTNIIVKYATSLSLPLSRPHWLKSGVCLDFRSRSGLRGAAEHIFRTETREQYCLAYTTIDLFRQETLPWFLEALEATPVDSKVFSTAVISAILEHGWRSARSAFYLNLLADVFVIVALTVTAHDTRHEHLPSRVTLCTIFFVATYQFSMDCVEMAFYMFVAAYHQYVSVGKVLRRGFRNLLGNFWALWDMMVNSYFFAFSVIGLWLKWQLLRGSTGWHAQEAEVSAFANFWFQAVVFLKSTHVAIQLMCLRGLGEPIIPAYCALASKSSVGFLFFLFLMYCCAVLTFHAVPTKVYTPDKKDQRPGWDVWENIFDLLILQFHVTFLGESDPLRLEGANERVRGDLTGGNWTGEILNPSTHPRSHHVLQITNVLFLLLIHLLLLHVYVGVLSQQYNYFVRQGREHFEKFRCIFTMKMVMRFSLWRFFFCGCRSSPRAGEHTWIAYKTALFQDPFDEKRQAESVRLLRSFTTRLDLDEDREELLQRVDMVVKRLSQRSRTGEDE